MTSHLDELAKGMASGMSRRRALKLFGTGLLGSAAAVVLPSAATARTSAGNSAPSSTTSSSRFVYVCCA